MPSVKGGPCGLPRAGTSPAPTFQPPRIQAGAAGALRSKPRRRKAADRASGGTSNRGRSPLIGRFKGMGAGKGGNRNRGVKQTCQWHVCTANPAAALPRGGNHRGARRRHNKKAVVKKGNMEGASARHKTGRCGQKVVPRRGKRGRPGASAPTLRGRPSQRITA